MGRRGREFGSWDTLVKKATDSLQSPNSHPQRDESALLSRPALRLFRSGSSRQAIRESSSSIQAPHTPRNHIPRGPRMARPPIRRLGKRRRESCVVEMLSKRTCLRCKDPSQITATTVKRRVTMRQSVPSQRRTEMPQKTSDSLDNLRFNDWSSLLS